MSSAGKNLSSFDPSSVPDAKAYRFGIVISEWNSEITEALYTGAFSVLKERGALDENIIRLNVPGSFELTAGAKCMVENEKVDAVICIGCVIKGETSHFDYICSAVSNGISNLNNHENGKKEEPNRVPVGHIYPAGRPACQSALPTRVGNAI
jgi:6,7-dimethyl-8-ribityllumazine synthase